MSVAALFVQPDGVYADLAADLWPEARDARTYAGALPVVAHPPCERWGRFATKNGATKGDDNGCFAAALSAVRRWRGVLEHPVASAAWAVFGLVHPPACGGWVYLPFCGGWTCRVDQGHYGHRAPKATWLYAFGGPGWLPPSLRWGNSSAAGRVEKLSKRQREATPVPFARLLLDLAASAGRAGR